MFTPAAKRRRVDTANETLRKPFKSPMVRDREEQVAGPAAAKNPAAPSPQPKPKGATRADSDSGASPGSTTATTATTAVTRPQRDVTQMRTPVKQMATPTRRPFSVPRPQLHPGPSPSPLKPSLHGTARSVTKGGGSVSGSKTTREVEGREEILRQAGRIRSGGEGKGETDEELMGLIEKWRAASRIAAEEVFEGSRERVEGMGGLKAWRRAQREDRARFAERMMEENGEGRGRGQGDEGVEESSPGHVGEEGDCEVRKDDEDEDEASTTTWRRGERGTDLQQEFTMGTMLRSMNIDFDIIGYDENTGWWRDG
ncbi:dna repair protein dds20 mei5 [Colletotrichum incanum]|uniref:Dna repair protein dds20 mei5 n=1 Tax=Colletotrichum incanum TaxID=1573173 RepID=A0A167D0C6_COLIC|nr:dna repair protein dds20 mei5 [Colletotrichum incanum]OHW93239.1 DNA repair protein dds20 mei5 [Colletotrichum incanum]